MDFNLKFLLVFVCATAIVAWIAYMLKRPRRKRPDPNTPSNDLETAILLAASNNFQRPEAFGLLAKSKVFVLGSISPDKKLALKHWNIDEKPLMPAFTSVERLREAITHKEHYIEIDAPTFLKSIPGNSDIILNPNSRFSMEIRHEEIGKVLEDSNHKGTEAQS